MLSSHLHLGLPSGVFPSNFPTKILYAFLMQVYDSHISSILTKPEALSDTLYEDNY
jgi:hypothetical protein